MRKDEQDITAWLKWVLLDGAAVTRADRQPAHLFFTTPVNNLDARVSLVEY